MRMISELSLFTARFSCLSQSNGTVTLASNSGSVRRYASERNSKSLTGSGSPSVNRQPSSSRSGSTMVIEITSSSPLSILTMIDLEAQGQAYETYRW